MPNTSPYGAPILFARKNIRTLRIYIDCWTLNQKTRPDKYPLPSINDFFNCLIYAHCFSSIDVHTCYYQVVIRLGDE